MRCLIALAVIATTACALKFPDKHEGSFACKQDSDCTAPFICKGNTCVDLNGAARCAQPTITGASTPATSQYVGFSFALTGTATSADPTCPIGDDTAWLVCDAPAGSKYATTDGTSCTHLADGDAATFTPDVHGAYNLTLSASAGDATGSSIVPITALADALFVELTFTDTRTLQSLIQHEITPGCYTFDQSTCGSHPECMFDSTYNTCWTLCTPLPETDCNNESGQCTYDSGSSSCVTALNNSSACIVRINSDSCNAIPHCIWEDAGLCIPDCSLYATEDDCTNAHCAWDAATSVCGGSSAAAQGFTEVAVAQLYTDGSASAPLYFGGTAQYRFDPNGLFTDVYLGTGLEAAQFGLTYDPVSRVALVPHAYIFQTPAVGGQIQCQPTMTMLLWRQGDTFGRPEASPVPALVPVTSNVTDASAMVYTHSVGFPKLVVRDNGTSRFLYGDAVATSPLDLTSGNNNCNLPDGSSDLGEVFALLPLTLTAKNLGPFTEQIARPLFIGDSGSGGAVTRVALMATAGKQPCRSDADCGGGHCTAAVCDTDFQIQGYLPQPMAKGDALTYTHLSCGSAYGAACTGGEYDLMLSRITSDATPTTVGQTFALDKMVFVSAEPGVKELEAFIPGDIFGALTRIYYLVSEDKTVNVNVNDSGTTDTTTATLPVFSLHWRTLQWDANAGWSVSPAATATDNVAIAGSIQTTEGAQLPCALDGVANRIVTTQATIQNPIQFAFSPDGRYLAFSNLTVLTACENAIFGTGGQLAASSISSRTCSSLI